MKSFLTSLSTRGKCFQYLQRTSVLFRWETAAASQVQRRTRAPPSVCGSTSKKKKTYPRLSLLKKILKFSSCTVLRRIVNCAAEWVCLCFHEQGKLIRLQLMHTLLCPWSITLKYVLKMLICSLTLWFFPYNIWSFCLFPSLDQPNDKLTQLHDDDFTASCMNVTWFNLGA